MPNVTGRERYCTECHAWTNISSTPQYVGHDDCGRCGEPYKCDNCGFETDTQEQCQREIVTGEKCEFEEESNV